MTSQRVAPPNLAFAWTGSDEAPVGRNQLLGADGATAGLDPAFLALMLAALSGGASAPSGETPAGIAMSAGTGVIPRLGGPEAGLAPIAPGSQSADWVPAAGADLRNSPGTTGAMVVPRAVGFVPQPALAESKPVTTAPQVPVRPDSTAARGLLDLDGTDVEAAPGQLPDTVPLGGRMDAALASPTAVIVRGEAPPPAPALVSTPAPDQSGGGPPRRATVAAADPGMKTVGGGDPLGPDLVLPHAAAPRARSADPEAPADRTDGAAALAGAAAGARAGETHMTAAPPEARHLPAPALSPERLTEYVATAMRRSRPGRYLVSGALEPPRLGRVQVSIELTQGSARVSCTVANAGALQALGGQEVALRHLLSGAGIVLVGYAVSLAAGGGGGGSEPDAREQPDAEPGPLPGVPPGPPRGRASPVPPLTAVDYRA